MVIKQIKTKDLIRNVTEFILFQKIGCDSSASLVENEICKSITLMKSTNTSFADITKL